ncbi:MAG: ATP-grasp domain-containing protein [bacterium]
MNKKIKVAVLLGGNTNEREISLESGRNICYKLNTEKYEVLPIFVDDKMELYRLDQKLLVQNSTREIEKKVTEEIKVNWSGLSEICDFVFIALHGGFGENGAVQGTLEMLGLPYNGSGVLTSAICMDKVKTTDFLRAHGFDVPNSFLIQKNVWQEQKDEKQKEDFLKKLLKDFEFPVIVKPHDDGCSFGVAKIENIFETIKQIDNFFVNYKKDSVLIEELIKGMELTCGVIGNDKVIALPPSKAVAAQGILSIEEKFLPGAGENITPAPLPEESLKFVQKTMQDVYSTLNCKGYARVDCFFQNAQESKTKKDRVVILEINSLPGMTPATCIFHQAAEIGIRPMEFVDKIVELGFENHKQVKTDIKNKIYEKIKQTNV